MVSTDNAIFKGSTSLHSVNDAYHASLDASFEGFKDRNVQDISQTRLPIMTTYCLKINLPTEIWHKGPAHKDFVVMVNITLEIDFETTSTLYQLQIQSCCH